MSRRPRTTQVRPWKILILESTCYRKAVTNASKCQKCVSSSLDRLSRLFEKSFFLCLFFFFIFFLSRKFVESLTKIGEIVSTGGARIRSEILVDIEYREEKDRTRKELRQCGIGRLSQPREADDRPSVSTCSRYRIPLGP